MLDENAGDFTSFGESSELQPEHLAPLFQRRDEILENLTFLRRATTFEDTDGQEYKIGLDEITVTPHEVEPGKFWAELKSHKKTVLVTGAAILISATAGVYLAKNRTQRQKMGKKSR